MELRNSWGLIFSPNLPTGWRAGLAKTDISYGEVVWNRKQDLSSTEMLAGILK